MFCHAQTLTREWVAKTELEIALGPHQLGIRTGAGKKVSFWLAFGLHSAVLRNHSKRFLEDHIQCQGLEPGPTLCKASALIYYPIFLHPEETLHEYSDWPNNFHIVWG